MNAYTTLSPGAAILRTAVPTDRDERLRALFAAFDRDDMEAGVDLLIQALDAMDGDPDVEMNGDELDGTGGEDCFGTRPNPLLGPGCPIADPDYGVDDDGQSSGTGDIGWTEWQTRGRHKVDADGAEIVGRDACGNLIHEDREDDDADTGAEDDPRGFDPEEDRCLAGDDGVFMGPVIDETSGWWRKEGIGNEDDAEPSRQSAQTPIAANEVEA